MCYEELHRLVGPPVDKLVYLRVLDSGVCSSSSGGVNELTISCVSSVGKGDRAR